MRKLITSLFRDLTLFKIIIAVVSILFVIQVHKIAKNGRFIPVGNNKVMDTRNGNIYETFNFKGDYNEPFIPSNIDDR